MATWIDVSKPSNGGWIDVSQAKGPGATQAATPELPDESQQGVTRYERLVTMNAAPSPEKAVQWLRKRGYEAELYGGADEYKIKVRKPGDKSWKVVDPKGADLGDVTDIIADIGVGVASGAGAALGGGATLGLGTVAGSAGGAAAGEAARRGIGSLVGMEQEGVGETIKDIAAEGAFGAAAPVVGHLAGKAVSGVGKKIAPRLFTTGVAKAHPIAEAMVGGGRALKIGYKVPGAVLERIGGGEPLAKAKKEAIKHTLGQLKTPEVRKVMGEQLASEVEQRLSQPLLSVQEIRKAGSRMSGPWYNAIEKTSNEIRDELTKHLSRAGASTNKQVRQYLRSREFADLHRRIIKNTPQHPIKGIGPDEATRRLEQAHRDLLKIVNTLGGRQPNFVMQKTGKLVQEELPKSTRIFEGGAPATEMIETISKEVPLELGEGQWTKILSKLPQNSPRRSFAKLASKIEGMGRAKNVWDMPGVEQELNPKNLVDDLWERAELGDMPWQDATMFLSELEPMITSSPGRAIKQITEKIKRMVPSTPLTVRELTEGIGSSGGKITKMQIRHEPVPSIGDIDIVQSLNIPGRSAMHKLREVGSKALQPVPIKLPLIGEVSPTAASLATPIASHFMGGPLAAASIGAAGAALVGRGLERVGLMLARNPTLAEGFVASIAEPQVKRLVQAAIKDPVKMVSVITLEPVRKALAEYMNSRPGEFKSK